MTTANTIIKAAMVEIGAIGMIDTPEADDSAHALLTLNRMLDAWRVKNLYAYHVGWQSITLTSAMQTRTIGAGGQVNVTRPVRLMVGSYSEVGGIAYELNIATRDKWASIDLKTLAADHPEWVYYEAASPLGTLHFWPQGACTVYLALETQLSSFADLTTEYTLPQGYEDAITLSLAERLCRPFSRPMPDTLRADAGNARRAIKANNFQVPELCMPEGNGRHRLGNIAEFMAG